MVVRALTWNLFHGRDFPPDPALRTWRARLLRISERGETHLQVNRDLFDEFGAILSGAEWDVALLQEAPPRWSGRLAEGCGAEAHRALTARNSLGWLRSFLARVNPDLIASNEGGSNLTLVRRPAARITGRRELELRSGPGPERRMMAFTALELADGSPLCVANLHLSAGRARRHLAEDELLCAAEHAIGWAGVTPLLFGGDLNLRPAETDVYAQLRHHFALVGLTGPDALDHLLVRGLTATDGPAAWAPERREVRAGELAIRLSDHAPVVASFADDRAAEPG
jgi:endonuclease/exonuclease/phosphatase family metal-dependent hydrolase